MSSIEKTGQNLELIVRTLEHTPSYMEVALSEDDGAFKIETTKPPLHRYFLNLFYPLVTEEGQKNTQYFEKVFGKRRSLRILSQLNISQVRTRGDIKHLFVMTGELFFQDLVELLKEIKAQSPKIRYLNENETATIRAFFEGVASIEECDSLHLRKLQEVLLPFSKVEHLFFEKVPVLRSISLDSGQDWASQKRRVFAYELLRSNLLTHEQKIMLMAKVLAGREMPPGVVFSSPALNLLKVHRVLLHGGAYKYFIKAYGKSAKEEGNYILYRETRPLPTSTNWWSTLVDDMMVNLGSWGATEGRIETAEMLSDPRCGFIDAPGQKVTGIGFSLGGAHLQYDMAFHRVIQKAIIVSSPGIDEKSCQVFADRVNRGEITFQPQIDYYFEDKDVVDQFGQSKLGRGCNPEKATVSVHIMRPKSDDEPPATQEEKIGSICRARKVFYEESTTLDIPIAVSDVTRAFLMVHSRHTTFQAHDILKLSSEQKEQFLSHRPPFVYPRWEEIRKTLSKALLGSRGEIEL